MEIDPNTVMLRRSLTAAGYSDKEIVRMLQSGDLTPLRYGSYTTEAPSNAEAEHLLRLHAALQDLSDVVVVSHATAVLLYGLPTWSLPLGRVQVSRQRRRSGGRVGTDVHVRVAPLDSDEIVDLGGIAVTSPARTVVDLARTVPFEQGVVVADAALRSGLVNPVQLAEAVTRAGRWPGTPRARRVVAFADGRSESVGESRSRVRIDQAGLPKPDLQVEVRDARGRVIARCDFGWEQYHTVGEFDGFVKYERLVRPGQTPSDVVFAEKRREDAIRGTGQNMVRWVWDELGDFAPTAARIRRALGLP